MKPVLKAHLATDKNIILTLLSRISVTQCIARIRMLLLLLNDAAVVAVVAEVGVVVAAASAADRMLSGVWLVLGFSCCVRVQMSFVAAC